jgi:hypothetical protein
VSVPGNDLQERWFTRALERADIDRTNWHPRQGMRRNSKTVRAVYGYYGKLFAENRDLMWAGMAAMIGPSFFAGFEDMAVLPDALRETVGVIMRRSQKRLTAVESDLDYYETTFLTMQKKIFEDQAPMHEAYLADGITEIEKFYDAGIIDGATLDAWRQIDAGRGAASQVGRDTVAYGNRMLLFREQYDIIDRYYARMLTNRRLLGPVFTYLMTLTGAPSVPRARSYPQRYPLRLQARVPRMVISARTPLAAGNIAHFADRWKLIETDTLPSYLALLRDHPDQASEILSKPAQQRARAYRLLARVGPLAVGAVTHWGVVLRRVAPTLLDPDTQPAQAPPRTAGREYELVQPLPPRPAPLEGAIASKVWADPRHPSFPVRVELPGNREYRARAEIAVMLSSTIGGAPDRLMVRLPPVSLEAGARLIRDYAEQWHFSDGGIDEWHVNARSSESGDRRYRTHVFRASDIDGVHLEFQVSHHVRERDVVIAPMFSWPGRESPG